MKKLLLILFVFLALAGGVVYFVMPSNYDWDKYAAEMAAEVRKQTGLTLQIQGKPQFSMAPAPTLTLGKVTLSNVANASFPRMMEAQSAVIYFDKGLAFKRQVHIKKITLNAPKLSLERLPDGKWNWQAAFFDRRTESSTVGFDSLLMTDATVEVKPDKYTPVEVWQKMNAELLADSATGPFFFEGSVAAGNTSFGFSFKADRFAKGESPDVSLRVVNAPAEATFVFSGKYGLGDKDKGDVTGNLSFDVRKPEALFALVSAQKLPAALFQPVVGSLKVKKVAALRENTLSDFLFKYGGTSASGTVKIKTLSPEEAGARQSKEEEDADLDLILRDPNNPSQAVKIDDTPAAQTRVAEFLMPKEYTASFVFTKFAGDVFFDNMTQIADALASSGYFSKTKNKLSADITIDAAEYKNNIIRRLKVTAESADKGVRFKNLSALLPGDAQVDGSGLLSLVKTPEFDAQLSVKGENLGNLLRWLNVPVDKNVPDALLRALDVSGALKLSHGGFVVNKLSAKIDRSEIGGALSVRFGTRPAVQANLTVSEFDAGLYFPSKAAAFSHRWQTLKPQDTVSKIRAFFDELAFLNNIDVALKLRAGTISFAEIEARKIDADLLARQGTLDVKNFTAQNIFGADVALNGMMHRFGAEPAFKDLRLDVDTDKFQTFVSNFGLNALPAEITRYNASRLSIAATGDLTSFEFSLSAANSVAKLDASGEARMLGDGYGIDCKAKITHYNFRQFVRLFTEKYRSMVANPGVLNLEAYVRHTPQKTELLSFEAKIGESGLIGEMSWEKTGDLPLLTMNVQAQKFFYTQIMPSLGLTAAPKESAGGEEIKVFSKKGLLAELDGFAFPKTKITADFLGDYNAKIVFAADKIYSPSLTASDVQAAVELTPDTVQVAIDRATIDGAGLTGTLVLYKQEPSSKLEVNLAVSGINAEQPLFDNTMLDLTRTRFAAMDIRGSGTGGSMSDIARSFDANGAVTFESAVLTGMDQRRIVPELNGVTAENMGTLFDRIMHGNTDLFKITAPFEIREGKFIAREISAQYGTQRGNVGEIVYDFDKGEFNADVRFAAAPYPDYELRLTKHAGQTLSFSDNVNELAQDALQKNADKVRSAEEQQVRQRQNAEKKAQDDLRRQRDKLASINSNFTAALQSVGQKVDELNTYSDVYQVQRYYKTMSDTYREAGQLSEEMTAALDAPSLTSDEIKDFDNRAKNVLLDKLTDIERDYKLAVDAGFNGRVLNMQSQATNILSDIAAMKTKYPNLRSVTSTFAEVAGKLEQLKKKAEQIEAEKRTDQRLLLKNEATALFDEISNGMRKVQETVKVHEKRLADKQAARIAAENARKAAEAKALAEEQARLKAEEEAKAAEKKRRQSIIYKRGSAAEAEESDNAPAVLRFDGEAPIADEQPQKTTGGIIRRR